MHDARHDLLSDITAFVEIDAGELIQVCFVRKRIAIYKIETAPRVTACGQM